MTIVEEVSAELYTKPAYEGAAETTLGERPKRWIKVMRKSYKRNRSALDILLKFTACH